MSEEFTIIIPVYNRADIVARTLDSVRAQTYRPLHLIVVDNASTDDTFAAITEWGRCNTGEGLRMSILKEPQKGAPAARNRGLLSATSDKILFFDSDDTMRPTLVSEAVRAFEDTSRPDIVTWKCCLHPLEGKSVTLHHLPGDPWHLHLVNSIFRTHGYAVRRSFINAVGGWDSAMNVWNDWELGIRILLSRPRIKYIDDTFVDVYSQPHSITGLSFSAKAGEWEKTLRRGEELILDNRERLLEDYENGLQPNPDHLLRLIAYRRVILAAHYSREHRHDLANTLLESVWHSDEIRLSRLQRLLLRFAYHYTRLGMRGAAHIVAPFL